MPRGAAGGVATFALTAALASDNGGFDAATWNLALIAVCAAALAVVVVEGGVARPTPKAAVFLAALGALTVWTAVSYFWSDSPPLAPVEAQRVALYFSVATAVVVTRRWFEPRWVAGGVVAAVTFVAVWNIVARIHGVTTTTGASADPVGYANSLAILCVLGLVLMLMLPRPAFAVAPVLLADLVLQHSTGSIGALVVALAFLALRSRARPVALLVLVACVIGAPFALRGHERTAYWHVAVHEAEANSVVGSGAGTFADWWLRERTDPTSTKEAHALYLETLAELGPLGLALVLLVFAVPIAAGARSPLGAAVLAYAVGAAADFHWELAGATVPAVLIAALVVSRPRARRSPWWPPALLFACLAAASVPAYAGNAYLANAQDALRRYDVPRAVAQAHDALRFAPYSADAWAVIGQAQSSADAYRHAVELDPENWSFWSGLAAVSHGESRRLALHEAARLNPVASEP